jgi:hypothetical protein
MRSKSRKTRWYGITAKTFTVQWIAFTTKILSSKHPFQVHMLVIWTCFNVATRSLGPNFILLCPLFLFLKDLQKSR